MAEALRLLGRVAFEEAGLAEARRRLEEAAAIHRSGGDRWQEVVAASEAGNVAALMADMPAALDHYPRSVDLVDDLSLPDQLALLLQGFVPFLWELGLAAGGRADARRLRPGQVWNDFIREVALRVTASELETARVQGTRFSFSDTIA